MRNPKLVAFMAVIVAFAQIGVLLFMVGSQMRLLKSGREVILKIEPVDPRDFMRGDYVRLAYPVLEAVRSMNTDTSNDIYVLLRKNDQNNWLYIDKKEAPYSNLSSNEVQLHGYERNGAYSFGIERFYVPEGQGREIENQLDQKNSKRFDVVIVVSPSGDARIKSLRYDEQNLFDVPWY